MAKISKSVREAINVIIFLVVVGLVVTFYMVYPLNKSADFFGRQGSEDFHPDSLPANDPTAFVEAGFVSVDTFRVESDGLTNLAVICLDPEIDSASTIRGSVVLTHDETADRTSMIDLAGILVDSGFSVVVYDQRATGLSTGKHHGEGQYEATDLMETIGYLQLRNRIHRPLIVVGWSVGGEAAILAPHLDDRIDRAVAIEPYLSSVRLLDLQKADHGSYWFPFYRTIMWWWYGIRSGYAAPYRTIDDLRAVSTPTLIFMPEAVMADEEVVKLQELSGLEILEVRALPEDQDELYSEIISYVTQ